MTSATKAKKKAEAWSWKFLLLPFGVGFAVPMILVGIFSEIGGRTVTVSTYTGLTTLALFHAFNLYVLTTVKIPKRWERIKNWKKYVK
jgi:hypothetical protein